MEENKRLSTDEEKDISTEENKLSLPRRDFLKKSLITVGGISLPFIAANSLRAQEEESEGEEDPAAEGEGEGEEPTSASSAGTRTLGKIGEVSALTFGGHLITDIKVIEAAVNKGITMIDTAPGYYAGQSEEIIGKYLKANEGVREKLIISTKLPIEDEDPAFGGTEEKILASIEKSLKRLNTKYIDIVYVHGVGGIYRVDNEKLHSAFAKAKEKGWVKYLGLSSFNGDMKDVVEKAIDSGKFDVIMMYYNYVRHHDKHQEKYFGYAGLIEKAKAKNIGIVASEPFAGGFDITKPNFRNKDFRGSALKWVLENQNISSVRVPIRNHSDLERYLNASQGGSSEEGTGGSVDESVLKEYQQAVTEQWNHSYCRACDVCIPVCIFNVAIPDILRYRTQFENFGMEKKAILSYKKLLEVKNQAVYCQTCSEPCKHVCPFGVDIKPSLLKAHQLLSL